MLVRHVIRTLGQRDSDSGGGSYLLNGKSPKGNFSQPIDLLPWIWGLGETQRTGHNPHTHGSNIECNLTLQG